MRKCGAVFVLISAMLLLSSVHCICCFGAGSHTLWVRELGVLSLGITRSLIRTFDGGFAVVGGEGWRVSAYEA
jgi:hypothetical protein